MKKTISIHLTGFNFLLEEDAYELVKNYLDRLKESLRNSKDQQEICEDVELRIAELATEVLTEQKKQVLTYAEMQQILATLGQPEEFLDDAGDEIPWSENTTNNDNGSKRLFRDPEMGLLGGVCTGLAAYFRLDVVLIRILFVVAAFFAGFAVAAYLILWIVVPAVRTNLERLKMQGRPVNIENLKEEFNDAAQRVRKNSRNFENELRNPNSPFRQRLQTLTDLLKRVIGLALLVFGCFLLIMVIYFSFIDMSMLPFNNSENIMTLDEIGDLILADKTNAFYLWLSILIAGIALVLSMLLTGATLLFNLRSKWTRPIHFVLGIAIVVGIVSASLQGIRTGRDFAINGEIEYKIGDVQGSLLTVQIQSDYRSDVVRSNHDFEHNVFEVSGTDFVEGGIDVYYANSTDSLFHVYAEYSARGETKQKAIQRSKDIRHTIDISGQVLRISPHFKFPKKDKLRDQSVRLIIQIPPQGKVAFPDKEIMPHQVDEWGFIRKNEQYEHYGEDPDEDFEAYEAFEEERPGYKSKTVIIRK